MYAVFYRGSDYLGYPLFALGVFFTFFLAMLAWAYWPRRGEDPFRANAALPLEEDGHGPR